MYAQPGRPAGTATASVRAYQTMTPFHVGQASRPAMSVNIALFWRMLKEVAHANFTTIFQRRVKSPSAIKVT